MIVAEYVSRLFTKAAILKPVLTDIHPIPDGFAVRPCPSRGG